MRATGEEGWFSPRTLSERIFAGGGALRFFFALFTLIFRLFQKFVKRRFFSLISAYFSAYFLFFVKIFTIKFPGFVFFPPQDFNFFPHREKVVRDLCFLGPIFFTHPGDFFPQNLNFF